MNTTETAELPAAPYDPAPLEVEAAVAALARYNRAVPAPEVILREPIEGGTSPILEIEHQDPAVGQVLLTEALGATRWPFAYDIIAQLTTMFVDASDPSTYPALNTSLESVKGMQPRDETEALMAVQMTAVHRSLVRWTARANRSSDIAVLDAADKAINRLARTYAAQMEALKRYRSSGQQKVTVEHVNVHAGGQAVVGNVTTIGAPADDIVVPMGVRQRGMSPLPKASG